MDPLGPPDSVRSVMARMKAQEAARVAAAEAARELAAAVEAAQGLAALAAADQPPVSELEAGPSTAPAAAGTG